MKFVTLLHNFFFGVNVAPPTLPEAVMTNPQEATPTATESTVVVLESTLTRLRKKMERQEKALKTTRNEVDELAKLIASLGGQQELSNG